jgi:phenylacetate-CoA ligase
MMNPRNDSLSHIHSHVVHVPWPPMVTGVAATLAVLLHELESSQWLSHEVILQKQLEQLSLLVNYAAQYSPYFKAKCEQMGARTKNIATLEDLRQLPILMRSDIQQAGESLHCTEVPKTHMPWVEAKSSGSTGEPVVVRKSNINGLLWQANMMREHFWHQRDFRGSLLVIRNSVSEPVQQDGWGPPVNVLYKSGRTMGLPILTNMDELLKAILDFKPEHINIYPSTLDALINHCQKQGVTIDCIKHIWAFSENLTPPVRQRAKDFFGASVEDDYSSNELGIIALQCPVSGLYHVMAETVLLEVLDAAGNPCAPGEIGRVVATSLHNFAAPLIRYDTGDYAQVGPLCPCGRGLPTLQSIKGRTRNMVTWPDGTKYWPLIGYQQYSAVAPITQFQFIQHDLQHIEARLVVTSELTLEQESALCSIVHKSLGYPFTIRFSYFQGRIPTGKNGKFEEFISMIA